MVVMVVMVVMVIQDLVVVSEGDSVVHTDMETHMAMVASVVILVVMVSIKTNNFKMFI